ncbi:ABC transporter permease subunit [Mesosutterella sp. OilRF-GAM-744-9]|uniref:ABC transporter permease subunit n=1 Tax=Mesosutterella porci TaxID=2915351 RepID=A0ABS9MNT0_9BURK|nr:nickel/cobalt ABC transporter permease [Mesosutterella sp. oilRF-744-WT-GAM-9]MCG5030037.1 ABC transporter permease subunit [Mesosutterella sp. oilRF-744-WT-GAM-9]
MGAYVLRRLLHMVPILLGITFIAFILISLSPSDPAEVALRLNDVEITPEVLEHTRHELGLDRPILERYASWLGAALQGDFGRRYSDGHLVSAEIAAAFPATLELALAALAIIVAASAAGGWLCAKYEGRALDHFIRATLFASTSMPSFWAGLLFMWLFSVKLGWLPTSGMEGRGSVILPAVTLSLAYIGTYTRLIRANLIANKTEGYVLWERAMGLPARRIGLHMLKNSLQSSITALGMSIAKLFAGAFVVESIFAWPGLGRLAVTAIFNRDYPVVQAYVLIMAVMFVGLNFLSDLINAWLDPRQREGD